MSGKAITLEKARDYFSRELSCAGDVEYLDDHIHEAIEFTMFHGGADIIREWSVIVTEGRFTFPSDLETPIRYKFCRRPDWGYGTFYSNYHSFSSSGVKEYGDYYDWNISLDAKSQRVFTQYRPPNCGVYICATTKCDADVGKQLIVSGKYKGNPIISVYNGHKVNGEVIDIYHENDEDKRHSRFCFDEFTGVTKDKTTDYVHFFGYGKNTREPYFLSHYTPCDENPSFREGEVFSQPAWCCESELFILGRVSPHIRYTQGEQVLPITSLELLRLLSKRAKYIDSGDFNEINNIEARIKGIIKKQVAYQQKPNNGLSFNFLGSGGSLTSL